MKPIIRPDSMLGEYLRLKEAGTPSEFPNVMADVQHKILLDAFRGFPSNFQVWTLEGNLADFKPHNRKWLSETQDLKNVSGGKPYEAVTFSDRGYAIALGTFGRTFALSRETVLNDDLNAFKKAPAAMGRAAKRTLVKQICSFIESNGNAYDANPLFSTRNSVVNSSMTALTADVTGISAVQAGLLAIATAKDPDANEIMGLQARYLVVAPALAEIAQWIVNAIQIGRGSTDGPMNNPLLKPALASKIEVVVEPFLTAFPNRWYLMADPSQCHAIEVGYLNGVKEPELFVKDTQAVRLAGGGRDDFGFDYDEITYKVRWDFGVQVAFYQPIFKGGN